MQTREELLKRPIGEFIDDCKAGLDAASKNGDLCACVRFASDINHLNDIVEAFQFIEDD